MIILKYIQWSFFVFLISLCVFGFAAAAGETSYEKWQNFFKKENSNSTAIVNDQGVSEFEVLGGSGLPESSLIEGEYISHEEWEKSGTKSDHVSNRFMSYEDARAMNRSLGIKSAEEYRKWVRSGERSDHAGNEFMSYEDAKSMVRSLRGTDPENEGITEDSGLLAEAGHFSDEDQLNRRLLSEKAIWKIQSNSGEGTGFFIGENYFITNFHVAVPAFSAGPLESITLLQEGNTAKLKVKKVLTLSAFHDLALIETEGKVTNYLNIKESSPDPEENLFLPAYPKGIFKRTKKTGKIFYEDDFIYSFPSSHFSFHGASGSPVLDERGEIAGVLSSGTENIVDVVKSTSLKEFILRDTGLDCSGYIHIRDCIKKEIENLKNLAEEGSLLAQFRLSFLYYEGGRVEGWKSEQSLQLVLKWSERAARQGYVPSQNSLATVYYHKGKNPMDGKRGNISSWLCGGTQKLQNKDISLRNMAWRSCITMETK